MGPRVDRKQRPRPRTSTITTDVPAKRERRPRVTTRRSLLSAKRKCGGGFAEDVGHAATKRMRVPQGSAVSKPARAGATGAPSARRREAMGSREALSLVTIENQESPAR